MWAFRVTGMLLLCVSSHKYTWTEIWVFNRLRSLRINKRETLSVSGKAVFESWFNRWNLPFAIVLMFGWGLIKKIFCHDGKFGRDDRINVEGYCRPIKWIYRCLRFFPKSINRSLKSRFSMWLWNRFIAILKNRLKALPRTLTHRLWSCCMRPKSEKLRDTLV